MGKVHAHLDMIETFHNSRNIRMVALPPIHLNLSLSFKELFLVCLPLILLKLGHCGILI